MSGSLRHPILVLAREFTLGGAAYLALRHMRRLLPFHEIDFLITGPCEEAMIAQVPPEISVFRLGINNKTFPGETPNIFESLFHHDHQKLFQRAYHAVLATSILSDWAACLVFSLIQSPRKWVFLVDEELLKYPDFPAHKQSAVDCALLSAGLVLPVSKKLWQKTALHCPLLESRPWKVLHPPLDEIGPVRTDQFRPWPSCGKPVLLTVARLASGKQIMRCLHVHDRLRKAGLDFRWYVVGTGPDEDKLRHEIENLGLADDFVLAGNQPDVRAWMNHCDAFALLSSSEGCPTVVMEALMLGCPVIATDVNGADELIQNGHNGLIVPNDPEAIEEGIVLLLKNAELRDRFRQNLSSSPPVVDTAAEKQWLVTKLAEPLPKPVDLPKVSILIPTYNHELYIGRAIASALMQDFADLEVIVSDDASTDGTQRLAQIRSADPRFNFKCNTANLGRTANYRKALEYARGDWVLVLDGDDYLSDPSFVRKAWDALERQADPALVFVQAGHRVRYLNQKRPIVDILPDIGKPEELMEGTDYVRFVYSTGFFTHLGTLYHREKAVAQGFYSSDISSSDMDSLLNLALEGKVLLLNTIAGCWVQHGANASSNLPLDAIAANVRIFRRIAQKTVKKNPETGLSLEQALTHYEALTLACLFEKTVGKTSQNPLDILKMIAITARINPRLILNPTLVSCWIRSSKRIAKLVWKRWKIRLGLIPAPKEKTP